jgi:hypothetical protein
LTSDFWGIYEVGFPEGSNMKAPEGLNFPLGPFFSAFLERIYLKKAVFILQEKQLWKPRNRCAFWWAFSSS